MPVESRLVFIEDSLRLSSVELFEDLSDDVFEYLYDRRPSYGEPLEHVPEALRSLGPHDWCLSPTFPPGA